MLIPCGLATGLPYSSLPLEGGELGRGCWTTSSYTLPLIPSPQGRGSFRYPAVSAAGLFIKRLFLKGFLLRKVF